MPQPVVIFLSDYGLSDEFVGVCHGVIARICPEARVVDLTHGVPRGDVRAGALVLQGALTYLPVGVCLAVVDPGVGGDRRAVAVRSADGWVFVGPDNGLLSLGWLACGGATEAVDIGRSAFALQPASATFHGRDIFAPVAAHVAGGASLAAAGLQVDPAGLIELSLPHARVEHGVLVGHVVYVDGFGNLQLDAEGAPFELGQQLSIVCEAGAAPARARVGRTFADVGIGELLVYEDSSRRLAVAVNHGNAAEQLRVAVGDELRVGAAGMSAAGSSP